MRKIPVLAILVLGASITPAMAQNQVMSVGNYNHTVGAEAYSGMAHSDEVTKALDLMSREKYSDALPLLRDIHDQSPHNSDVLSLLGFAHFKLGDNDAALDFFKRALNENPDNKHAHQYLGEFYLGANDLASAQAQLAELTRVCPTSCDERDALTSDIASYKTASGPQPAAQGPGKN